VMVPRSTVSVHLIGYGKGCTLTSGNLNIPIFPATFSLTHSYRYIL
jgi:hypothetical protein